MIFRVPNIPSGEKTCRDDGFPTGFLDARALVSPSYERRLIIAFPRPSHPPPTTPRFRSRVHSAGGRRLRGRRGIRTCARRGRSEETSRPRHGARSDFTAVGVHRGRGLLVRAPSRSDGHARQCGRRVSSARNLCTGAYVRARA